MTVQTYEGNGALDLQSRMRYAQAVAVAPLLPESFRQQPANILIAMEVADALGKRPFMVMQEMAVISGRPSFSAKFMRGLVRDAGHRLRESYTDGVARCEIVRKDDPEFSHVSTWDEPKARQHDYWGKGHWKKNPELMLKNRALSECVREACPEVLGGVAYTPDEVEDFAPARTTATQVPAADAPAVASIQDAVRVHQAANTEPGDPDPEPELLRTPSQARQLTKLINDNDLSADEALPMFSEWIGRPITSTKELTPDEADAVITHLTVDPDTGEVPVAADEDWPTTVGVPA